MVSRYGVWLLVGLCTPMKNVVLPDLTGMLSMLFEWYKVIMILPMIMIMTMIMIMKGDGHPPQRQVGYGRREDQVRLHTALAQEDLQELSPGVFQCLMIMIMIMCLMIMIMMIMIMCAMIIMMIITMTP